MKKAISICLWLISLGVVASSLACIIETFKGHYTHGLICAICSIVLSSAGSKVVKHFKELL